MAKKVTKKSTAKSSTDFVVRFDGISLSKTQKVKLSSEINAAVMRGLGHIDYKGDISARIPKEWLGIWIDRIRGGRLPGGGPRPGGL